MDGGHLLGADPILVEVEAVRLDDLFPVERIDLIRSDAEGSEPLIVEGARNLIDRNEDIKLCLEWSMPMIHRRADIPGLLADLASRRFRFWKTEKDSTLSEVSVDSMLTLPHGDVVLARKHPLEGNALNLRSAR